MASSSPGMPVDMTLLAGYLGDLAPKWMILGLKLGQETCVRELRQVDSMTEEDKCSVLVKKWVDSGKEVSLEKICSVLCSKGVELEQVAKQMQVQLINQELNKIVTDVTFCML